MGKKEWKTLSDQALLIQYCKGNNDALAYFVLDRHLVELRLFVRRWFPKGDTQVTDRIAAPQDLLHDMVMELIRKHQDPARRIKDCAKFLETTVNWFKGILKKRSIDHLRQVQSQNKELDPKSLEARQDDTVDAIFLRHGEDLETCIEALPEPETTFVRAYLEQLRKQKDKVLQEVEKTLGPAFVAEHGPLRVLLQRCKRHLKSCLVNRP